MNRLAPIILGALAVTALLGYLSAELIANRRPADAIDVLPITPLDPDALTRITLSPECEDRRTGLLRAIQAAGSCETDADCVALRLDCPFDCASAINQAEFAALFERGRQFSDDCGRCLAPCTNEPPPTLCRRGRCAFELVPEGLLRPDAPPPDPRG